MEYLSLVAIFLVLAGVTQNAYGNKFERAAHLTVDNYCKNTYGNTSYLCREQYTTGYDYVCDSLYCFDGRYTGACVFSVPPGETTICGNGKWCTQNSCQPNTNAQTSSDACPLGDSASQGVVLDLSCSDIVSKRPSLCRLDKVNKTWCCDSCASVNKTDPASFIGPAVSANDDCKALLGKNSYFCQTDGHYGSGYSAVCGEMRCMNPKSGNCEPYPASDGVPCGNGKWCADGQCTASPLAPANPKTECYYGNQFETFCKANVKFPNIALYCGKYEAGCCDICKEYKDPTAQAGCIYGDKRADVCQQHVKDSTIISYCHTNEADCCQTCAKLKNSTDPSCPYGDIDPNKCAALMNDSIGPGNCYSISHQQECCMTCPSYHNASRIGCEYGDHWKDYCATNVVPPKVAITCSSYEHQCCGTCGEYKESGHAGCEYGDENPKECESLMKTDLGTANCYDNVRQSQCCGTCEKLKDSSTPGCLYGDKKPGDCGKKMNDTRGSGNCYDIATQIDCCRTCNSLRNDTARGCEYGDRVQGYCESNILDQNSAFLCFQYESQCCQTCTKYKLSDKPDCKFGDKNPTNCKFMIPDEAIAAARCPTLGVQCCLTCSKFGHPGPAGAISQDVIKSLVG